MDRKQRYIQKLRTRDIPQADKKVVAFLVLESDTVDRKYPIKSGINFVGNDNDVDIQLNVPGVSGFHAMIETSDDGMEHFIEDLDSTNGTHLGPSNYPLGAWKLYQLIHKKMVAIGPATCIYQYVESVPKVGLGEYDEVNMHLTVDSKHFGSPIMIKSTKDFLPSDILKENSSPDSIALIDKQDSFKGPDKQESRSIIFQSNSQNPVKDILYSSDSELELPSHFGRHSNSSEEIEKDLGDAGRDDYEKSRVKDNFISAQNLKITNDEMKEVLPDSNQPAKNNTDNLQQVILEENMPKEIPKKRKLLGRKALILDSKNKDGAAFEDKKPKKNKPVDKTESPQALQTNLTTTGPIPAKHTFSKADGGDVSDESTLNLPTSDQILKEMIKNPVNAKKGVIHTSESTTLDDESHKILNSTNANELTNDQSNGVSEQSVDSRKQNARKARIQKKFEGNNEQSLFEFKCDSIAESRHSSTNSDLSIAIALSGGRGKRAAASKALERTKDMYHNLPPLVEEVLAPHDSKKIKKSPDKGSKIVAFDILGKPDSTVADSTIKSKLKKNDKKIVVSVKMESETTYENKTVEGKTCEFKENITKNYKIAFTGGHKDDRKPLESMIRKFGGSVVESWSDCTHLVTDKIRRTSKFLCALTTGKFIMNTIWLDACKKHGGFLDESSYLLQDDINEKKYKFSLKEVSKRTQKGLRLFQNLRFYATESVKPDLDALEEILNASGATLERIKPIDHQSIIILSCLEDSKELEKLQKMGYNDIQSMEFVLTGLLRQKLDYSRY